MSNQIEQARDTFLDNLHSMATGSYLREEDKEFWEAPYPESVVNEARVILDSLIDATTDVSTVNPEDLRAAAQSAGVTEASDEEEAESAPSVETLATMAAVKRPINDLLTLSSKHEDAVLEDEELADFNELIRAVSAKSGADGDAVVAYVEELVDAHHH